MASISSFLLEHHGSFGLLALRLAVGAAFVIHGWPKIRHPSDWMSGAGLPPAPVPVQVFAALAEFVGGVAIILGLLTPLASIALLATMLGALVTVHFRYHHPFVGPPGQPSSEVPVVYAAVMILLLLAGPGIFSVDAALTQSRLTAARDISGSASLESPAASLVNSQGAVEK